MNAIVNPMPDEQYVDGRDKMGFNRYINEDKDFTIRREQKPWMKAKVDYMYFGFDELFKGIRSVRNIFIIFFGLGYLSKTIL